MITAPCVVDSIISPSTRGLDRVEHEPVGLEHVVQAAVSFHQPARCAARRAARCRRGLDRVGDLELAAAGRLIARAASWMPAVNM
jgi:hypothetical protein